MPTSDARASRSPPAVQDPAARNRPCGYHRPCRIRMERGSLPRPSKSVSPPTGPSPSRFLLLIPATNRLDATLCSIELILTTRLILARFQKALALKARVSLPSESGSASVGGYLPGRGLWADFDVLRWLARQVKAPMKRRHSFKALPVRSCLLRFRAWGQASADC